MKKPFVFFLGVILLSYLSFHRSFNFGLIVDDWFQLWGAIFERPMLSRYFADHPGVALEFLLLSKIFGFNPVYYYMVSFFLKIIGSLAVSVFVYGLTKSRQASFLSGLIFASTVMGLEAFDRISAHYAAFSIIFLSLAMYFWVQNINQRFFRNTLASLSLVLIALLGDPGSSIMILPLLLIWDLLTYYQHGLPKQELKFYLVRIFLICFLLFLTYFIIIIRAQYYTANFYSTHIQYAATHLISSLNNYLNSIGHLVIGWVIPVSEMLGISNPTVIGIVTGYLLLVITILIFLLYIQTKKNSYKIIFFLLSWILVFYFPSWITQEHIVKGNLVIGVTNRYLAVSAVGVATLLAIMISKVKNLKLSLSVLVIIISVNIFTANNLLAKEEEYRSVKVQEALYNKIDSDVPKGVEKNSIFIFLGNNWFKVFALDWNGAYPFALKRNINKVSEFPVVLNNLEDAANKLCAEPERYRLQNVYAWSVDSQNIINISLQVQDTLSNMSSCHIQN